MKQKNESGQLSIFFATSMMIVITIMAFVINVGLYVKAKINLQNAVDAAAWSGAATQARHLTNIAYLNYEMRANFKEWMFKYYVLGNLSVDGVRNSTDNPMQFNLASLANAAPDEIDQYNLPSVCIHYSAAENICNIYNVPGLPRVDSVAGGGPAPVGTDFLNDLVSRKSEACANTSQLNYQVAMAWAYGMGDNLSQTSIGSGAPQVALHRKGAWPSNFELAVRIRNLEYILNSRPQRGGVCYASGAPGCSRTIGEIRAENRPLHNERTVKAYMSAFRNLGNEFDDEMKSSFTLTELAPNPVINENMRDLSNLLIPDGKRTKHYVDLKLHMVNYLTFFTSFANQAGDMDGTDLDAECAATKIGIPVPGFPFGFVKGPNTLTYYAVKGQANFMGLFNPFSSNNSPFTRLTAYAAAKPFGGRIGPHLFKSLPTAIEGRQANRNFRSSGYVVGFRSSESFRPGVPIPTDMNFWVSEPTQQLGGWQNEQEIRFAIPNLMYDVGGNSVANSPEKIVIIERDLPPHPPEKAIGLYDGKIFNRFKLNLGNQLGITNEQIEQAILRARAPTVYDLQNYLVPTPDIINQELGADSFGALYQPSDNGQHLFRIYAPLYGPNLLYSAAGELEFVLEEFLDNQDQAIQKYSDAMYGIRNAMLAEYASRDADVREIAEQSANRMADTPLSCNSILGKFIHFFYGADRASGGPCPTEMRRYFEAEWSNYRNTNDDRYYSSEMSFQNLTYDNERLFSAFAPGENQGASNDGRTRHPYLGSSELNIRNYYSAKFIPLNSLTLRGSYAEATSNVPIYSEGNPTARGQEVSQTDFANYLDLSLEGPLAEAIRH